MHSPCDFTLWDPTSLQSSLQYAVVKSVRVQADGCEIIVGLGKMYSDKIKYRYAPHNDVSVIDGPHIRRLSHKIIILQSLPLCYNCLQYSVQ